MVTKLQDGRALRMFRAGPRMSLRRFVALERGRPRPVVFSGERAALAGFSFSDAELCAIAAEKAARYPDDPVAAAVGLLDLERWRSAQSTP